MDIHNRLAKVKIMQIQLGQSIASYQLLAQIASGGQATVYRARHTVLQREVALKVLHAHLITDASFVQKFAQEAQLLAQLKHPNIVEVHNAGYDAATGAYFIEMELLPGSDLDTLIAQQGRLAVDVVVNVAKQVSSTLEYAHARGLIHRDIKPSNIILLPDGRVMVLDFGIAAIVAAGQKAKTRIGTVEYMAPEHFAGNADARSDIYSLGATLYHCLTGQVPPVVASQPPTPVRQLNPAVSPALENVILKSLQSDAAKRQQTAREFVLEIESALRAPQVSVGAPARMRCLHCGAANRAGARFCVVCGRAMSIAPKTYAGPLKVRMPAQPIASPSEFQPQFYWSPDAKNLAVHIGSQMTIYKEALIRAKAHFSDVWDLELTLNQLQGGYTIVENVASDSQPDWSPDGREIAYTSAKDGKIWVSDIVIQESKQLAFGDGRHVNPLLSPNKKYLAYAIENPIDRIGFPRWVTEQDLANWGRQWQMIDLISNIATKIGQGMGAGWSPGGKFACVGPSGDIEVFQNGSVKSIGRTVANDFESRYHRIKHAKWVSENHIAIEGMYITVVTLEMANRGIDLVNLATGQKQENWLPISWPIVTRPLISVASGRILDLDALILKKLGARVVWADASRSDYFALSSTLSYYCTGEDWSPDATKILFTRSNSEKGRSEICVVNTDDTGLQHLTDGYAPKWSPDGKYIAFLRSPQEKVYELWVMEVE